MGVEFVLNEVISGLFNATLAIYMLSQTAAEPRKAQGSERVKYGKKTSGECKDYTKDYTEKDTCRAVLQYLGCWPSPTHTVIKLGLLKADYLLVSLGVK